MTYMPEQQHNISGPGDATASGLIFNIQRFSLHDGPGIRTLVFLKGCPLRCVWCANPEGLSMKNQVLYNRIKCRSCGACMRCPEGAVREENGLFLTDQNRCSGCGECAKLCVYGARTMTNRRMSATEVVDICVRDNVFYKNSCGGLTLGGGDPMMQPHFTRSILQQARERGLNTAIETSAMASEEDFRTIAALCDTIHVDIKAVDEEMHRRLTGASNTPILRNLRAWDRLAGGGSRLILRIPLVADCNADMETVRSIGEFITSLDGKYDVEILPFHNFGESKYEQLCIPYAFADRNNMKPVEVSGYRDMLTGMGLSVTINTH